MAVASNCTGRGNKQGNVSFFFMLGMLSELKT